MKGLMGLVLTVVGLCMFIEASAAADYNGMARLHPDYTLFWTITTQNTWNGNPVITFTMQVNCQCWIGLGWHAQGNDSAGGMSEADFILTTFDPKNATHSVSVTDRYSTKSNGGYGPPVLDTDIGGSNNILGFTALQTSYPMAFSTVTVVREVKTGDTAADHPILPGPTNVIWAHGNLGSVNPNQLDYHGFGNRGRAVIDFYANTA